MKKAIPTQKEALFKIDELFFSTTDLKGIITAYNDVFCRISGHPPSIVMRSPHNIIRHPDMPKAIFKIFWETIKAGQPITAYVKNMAANGDHYWVVASVFPIPDGYLSVRFKPSSKFFPLVEKLYQSMLQEEKRNGIDSSQKLLFDSLNSQGFNSYFEFMAVVLREEMKSRDLLLEDPKTSLSSFDNQTYSQAYNILRRLTKELESIYKSSFGAVNTSAQYGADISNNLAKIVTTLSSLKVIATNVSLAAKQIGQSGKTLAVIAEHFQGIALEIQNRAAGFDHYIKKTLQNLTVAEYRITSARVQAQMVAYFVQTEFSKTTESNSQNSNQTGSQEGIQNIISYFRLLYSSLNTYTSEVIHFLIDFDRQLLRLIRETDDLLTEMSGLEIIRQNGRMEISRLDNFNTESFETFVTEMKQVIDVVGESIKNCSHMGNRLTMNLASPISDLREAIELVELSQNQL